MSAHTASAPVRARGVSFGGTLRSEWIKTRSIRSLFWCSVLIVVIALGFAALISAVFPVEGDLPRAARQGLGLTTITISLTFTALVAAVLGALTITGEYGTGMIRSTFTAVPKRIPALVAKAVVVVLVMLVVAAISMLGSLALAASILGARGVALDLGDGGLWQGMAGGVLYLALVPAFAFGIGLLLRNSAGSIATAIGVLFVLPIILSLAANLSRVDWIRDSQQFLPSNAGGVLAKYPDDAGSVATGQPLDTGLVLEWWQAALVMLAWAVVPTVVGLLVARRRDV